jgi:ABC-type transport system involved in multi-copper enzyme maturation permease subunit
MTESPATPIRPTPRPPRTPSVLGPIFTKELRCTGRRKRHYVVRFAYLALLTIVLVLMWMSTVAWLDNAPPAYRIMQMPYAGKMIISTIIWFQFIGTQLLAVILLSTSISDEVYHRTLGVLMTTPITGFQIVMGKLFSRLWMLFVLLGVSVPLLAIVRVFGGVPWGYVVIGMCITFTAMLAAASLSMLLSVFCRRAYMVILFSLIIGGVVYGLFPFLVVLSMTRTGPESELIATLAAANPFITMGLVTGEMFTPQLRGMFPYSWVLHCLVSLGVSGAVLAFCVSVVRKAALSQAAGQPAARTRPTSVVRRTTASPGRSASAAPAAVAPQRTIRRITGAPVVWKELRSSIFRGRSKAPIIVLIVAVALVLTYASWGRGLKDNYCHAAYLVVFTIIGTLTTAVLSAVSVTSEKESRSWPILLATPLSSWQIVWGKFVGLLWRSVPGWVLPLAHGALFVLCGLIHPVWMLHVVILAGWVTVFLAGTGLLFSTMTRRTTTAVVLNMGLGLFLWVILPFLSGYIMSLARSGDDVMKVMAYSNPLYQAGIIGAGTGGRSNASSTLSGLSFGWWGLREMGFWTMTWLLVAVGAVHSGIGLLLVWVSSQRLRRKVF